MGTRTAAGQFQPTFKQVPGRLEQPADVVAAGFYVTNLHNYVVDNAASGGWAGIIVPSLQAPVGLHRDEVDFSPNGRPTLLLRATVRIVPACGGAMPHASILAGGRGTRKSSMAISPTTCRSTHRAGSSVEA